MFDAATVSGVLGIVSIVTNFISLGTGTAQAGMQMKYNLMANSEATKEMRRWEQRINERPKGYFRP